MDFISKHFGQHRGPRLGWDIQDRNPVFPRWDCYRTGELVGVVRRIGNGPESFSASLPDGTPLGGTHPDFWAAVDSIHDAISVPEPASDVRPSMAVKK